ncbi:MAG TPA: hypothetical protein VJW77_00800 [Terriglobia bacterium]|nr:hypothetical protein [Terriglobia bacterium]
MLKVDVNSPQFNETVAQLAHFAWGALLMLAPYVLWRMAWLGPMVVLAWALPKEFWFDVKIEEQTAKDGLLDLSFYLAGMAVAILMIVFAK